MKEAAGDILASTQDVRGGVCRTGAHARLS